MEHYRLEWQSAQDCAAPLSHCLLLPEKEKGGEGKKRGGKKRLTAKNKSDTLKFPSFLLFTIKIFFFFLLGNSGISEEISAAQPVVWECAQAFHMHESWQQGKQPPT